MKRLFVAFALLMVVICASAERRVYIELLGEQKSIFSTKVRVKVDFGQPTSFWKSPNEQRLVSEDGKDINFNSMIDAMNYMGQFGWKFVQAYVITIGSQNVYHWLLYKDINNDDELLEGFMTKDIFKAGLPPSEKYSITYVKKSVKATEWDVVKEESKELTNEELQSLIDDWKAKSNDKYLYDVKVKKEK